MGKVFAVDDFGHYIGRLDAQDRRVKQVVPFGPPNDGFWYWNGSEYVMSQGVDAEGHWLGRAHRSKVAKHTPPPPTEESVWVWDFTIDEWVDATPLSVAKRLAKDAICANAKEIVASGMSDIKGMELIYAHKYKEAIRFLEGDKSNIEDYPYLQLEHRLIADKTVEEICHGIVSAKVETEKKLLALEEARRTSFIAIDAAQEKGSIDSAVMLFSRLIENCLTSYVNG